MNARFKVGFVTGRPINPASYLPSNVPETTAWHVSDTANCYRVVQEWIPSNYVRSEACEASARELAARLNAEEES